MLKSKAIGCFSLLLLGTSVLFASSGTRYEWKSVVKKFHELSESNEIKADSFKESFKGSILHGSGKVDRVEKCGFTDKSDKHGNDCISVQLFDAEASAKVYIYYPKSKSNQISDLNKGDNFKFDNCIATSITHWGFWSTATCDTN